MRMVHKYNVYNVRTGIKRIKTKTQRALFGLISLVFPATIIMASGGASAVSPPFALQPFTFNPGNACPGIQAQWDSSTGNPAPSVLLTKPCPTTTNAASGVDIITSLEGQPVSNLTELNFDYKIGEHCGAGAPRFNLQLDSSGLQNAFLGCAAGTQTPAGNGYMHVEYNTADIQAAVLAAGGTPVSTLFDLYMIFDEGTDTPTGGLIGTAGLVHVDNFSVNGQVVGSPTSPTSKDDCKNGGWQNMLDANGHSFKNQGDCVSYVATGGKNQGNGH
jgi:hypothetical protein